MLLTKTSATTIVGYKCDILHKEVDEKDIYIMDMDGTIVSKEALNVLPRFMHSSCDLLLGVARYMNDEKKARNLNEGIWTIFSAGYNKYSLYPEKDLKEAAETCTARKSIGYVVKDGELFKTVRLYYSDEIWCNGTLYGTWHPVVPIWMEHARGFSRIGIAEITRPMPNIGKGRKHIGQIQWRDEHGFVTENRYYEADCTTFSLKEDL